MKTTATIAAIAAALSLKVQSIYKRAKEWQPIDGSYPTRYDINTLQLRSGEIRKIKVFLARSACKVIPIHAIDKAAEQAEKERQRIAARAQGMELFSRLPAWQKTGAEAKLAIIQAAAFFVVDNKLARTQGQDFFTHEYNLGRIDVAPSARAEIRQLHPGTLRSWIAAEYEQGIMGLVDMYGNRKGQSKIETNEQLKNTLVALILDKPHIKACAANEALKALCPDAEWVSDKSVARYMEKWRKENPHEHLLATNPDAYKNKYQAAFGSRSEGIDAPNQLWEIDATPADLLLKDGRYKIIGLCDVGTRRQLLHVSKTEKAADNAHVIRQAILKWGVPAGGTLKTDNGSAYKSEHFMRIMRDLEIHQHFCKPFSGDEKPHVERGFKTFSHDLVELLPGYCGHSVADRKAIEAQKSFAKRLMDKSETIEISMTGQELQTFCDRWTATYHARKHSSLGCSPNQQLAAYKGAIHRISDERALDTLLAEAPKRSGKLPTVQKKGIKLDNGLYIHADLYPYIGQEVRVLYDPADLGKIMVYAVNEHDVFEFVCIAEDPNRTGISRAEVAAVARARQSQHKVEMRHHAKESKKALKGVDIVQAVLEHREREAAVIAEKVIQLPRPSIEYTTPGITAAAEARAALDGTVRPQAPKQIELSPEEKELKTKIKEELLQAQHRGVTSLPVESAKARYKRMKGLRDVLLEGGSITPEEYSGLMQYEQTAEHKAIKDMEADAKRAVK